MEDRLFPQPAVAGILTREYVEARLHVDHPDEVIQARNAELQAKYQGSLATPYYYLVDPSDERVLGEFAGATFDADEFADFLRAGAEQHERDDRLADAAR